MEKIEITKRWGVSSSSRFFSIFSPGSGGGYLSFISSHPLFQTNKNLGGFK